MTKNGNQGRFLRSKMKKLCNELISQARKIIKKEKKDENENRKKGLKRIKQDFNQ